MEQNQGQSRPSWQLNRTFEHDSWRNFVPHNTIISCFILLLVKQFHNRMTTKLFPLAPLALCDGQFLPDTSSAGPLHRQATRTLLRSKTKNTSTASQIQAFLGGETQLLAKAKAQADNTDPFRAAFPIALLAAGRGEQADDKVNLTVLLSKRCLRENGRRVSGQGLPCRHYS